MTDPRIPVTEDELHAYIDNELPAERRGDVEAWLATHPDDAERDRSISPLPKTSPRRYETIASHQEPGPCRYDLVKIGSAINSVQRCCKCRPGAVSGGWHAKEPLDRRLHRATREC